MFFELLTKKLYCFTFGVDWLWLASKSVKA